MLSKFERYPLTFGPTHIEKLERLSEHLGGKVELYAKREDCNSGLAFGGNKLRKLDTVLSEAVAAGADRATLHTIESEDMPLAYLPGNSVRVRVRVVGDVAATA